MLLALANSLGSGVGLCRLGLKVRFPLPWLTSHMRVYICVKLSIRPKKNMYIINVLVNSLAALTLIGFQL